MPRKASLLTLFPVLGLSGLLLYPLCDFLHRCGCEGPWGTSADRCNVRNAAGPHCPWCEHPALGAVGSVGTVGVQVLAYMLVRRRQGSWIRCATASVAALPVGVLFFGAAAWLPTDYPHFVVSDLRARLGLPSGPFGCVVSPGGKTEGGCCGPATPAAGQGTGMGRKSS